MATASRTYLITEYRAADGEALLGEAYTTDTIADLIGNAPRGNWDIMSVIRLTIRDNGTVTEDASAEVARAIIARYADHENGIPEDWTELFRRVGKSVVDINTETDIARAEDAAEWRNYQNGVAADYRRAAGF